MKMEEIDDVWPALARELARGSKSRGADKDAARAATLGAPFPEDHKNHHAAVNARTGKSSRLSGPMIRRMCDSPHYGEEWSCFDYPAPAACAKSNLKVFNATGHLQDGTSRGLLQEPLRRRPLA